MVQQIYAQISSDKNSQKRYNLPHISVSYSTKQLQLKPPKVVVIFFGMHRVK